MDRRISKTKVALKTSLTELMKSNNYKDISITELCDLANVNRGTFYLHYKSIDGLLKELEDDFFNKLYKVIVKHYPIKNNQYHDVCNDVIITIKDDQDFLRAVTSKNGDFAFLRKLSRYTKEVILKLNRFDIGSEEQPYLTFYMTFLVEGGLGVIVEWLNGGCKDNPHDIIKRFEKLLIKVIS